MCLTSKHSGCRVICTIQKSRNFLENKIQSFTPNTLPTSITTASLSVITCTTTTLQSWKDSCISSCQPKRYHTRMESEQQCPTHTCKFYVSFGRYLRQDNLIRLCLETSSSTKIPFNTSIHMHIMLSMHFNGKRYDKILVIVLVLLSFDDTHTYIHILFMSFFDELVGERLLPMCQCWLSIILLLVPPFPWDESNLLLSVFVKHLV